MLTGGMGTEGETGHMDKTQSNLSSEAEAGGIDPTVCFVLHLLVSEWDNSSE